jgi:LmbE family N-acetylglucosaminyl deacetylase
MNYKSLEQFDNTKRLLVVAAHPDDLETQCGGAVYLLAQRGVTIFSVNCTLGDLGSHDPSFHRPGLATTRLAETAAAAEVLGISQTFNLGRPDGELVADLAVRAEIAYLYRLTQADTVWTFDPYWTGQIHPDHRAAAQAAVDAYMPAKMPLYRPDQLHKGAGLGLVERIFFFGTQREPDIFVDIESVYEAKMASCRAHLSQFPKGDESLVWMNEMDGRRGEPVGLKYAESFRELAVW